MRSPTRSRCGGSVASRWIGRCRMSRRSASWCVVSASSRSVEISRLVIAKADRETRFPRSRGADRLDGRRGRCALPDRRRAGARRRRDAGPREPQVERDRRRRADRRPLPRDRPRPALAGSRAASAQRRRQGRGAVADRRLRRAPGQERHAGPQGGRRGASWRARSRCPRQARRCGQGGAADRPCRAHLPADPTAPPWRADP